MDRFMVVVMTCFGLVVVAVIVCAVLSLRSQDQGHARAFQACPYHKGDVVRVKLSGEKALVVDRISRIAGTAGLLETRCEVWLRIRTASHYDQGGQWKVRAQGFGGSTGGSRGSWVEVRPSEVEPWEESHER